jgi:hypothetical protein
MKESELPIQSASFIRERFEQPLPQWVARNEEHTGFLRINQNWEVRDGKEILGKLDLPFTAQSERGLNLADDKIASKLTYRRELVVPEDWIKAITEEKYRVKLKIDRVTYQLGLQVNSETKITGRRVGLAPVWVDIGEGLKQQNIIVAEIDRNINSLQPTGKQNRDGEVKGCFYRQSTGMGEMTVFLVPEVSLKPSSRYSSNEDGSINFDMRVEGPTDGIKLETRLKLNGKMVGCYDADAGGRPYSLRPDEQEWWSTENPQLYEVEHILWRPGQSPIQRVESYHGLRRAKFGKENGSWKFKLNERDLPLAGVLYQAYFPDSLYEHKNFQHMEEQIKKIKEYGFNFIRYHQNIPTSQFAALCDAYGLMWALEFPNWGMDDTDIRAGEVVNEGFSRALDTHFNSPSLVCLNPLNETNSNVIVPVVAEKFRKADPTRIFSNVSGFVHGQYSDIEHTDVWFTHQYSLEDGYISKRIQEVRNIVSDRVPVVLAETGGIYTGFENRYGNRWGYGDEKDWPRSREETAEKISSLWQECYGLYARGLIAGIVYTQWNSTGAENNGLVSDDGEDKFGKEDLQKIKSAITSFYCRS